jgi:hypothetical protein
MGSLRGRFGVVQSMSRENLRLCWNEEGRSPENLFQKDHPF